MTPNAEFHNPSPQYIRGLLEASGLTQRKAARMIGVSHRMLGYYIEHDGKYRAPYLVQFALECLGG